jgi:hypothetical protein
MKGKPKRNKSMDKAPKKKGKKGPTQKDLPGVSGKQSGKGPYSSGY